MPKAGSIPAVSRRGDHCRLVVKERTGLAPHKLAYAHDHASIADFVSAVKALRPTAIVVAAVGGAFTSEVLREMAAINKRPIVFALSNPTCKTECTAEEAYAGAQSRALFACGSPFDPVTLNGRTFVPRQGHNSYIFPGVDMGAIACKAKRVTDEMFLAAANAFAQADLIQINGARARAHTISLIAADGCIGDR